MKLKRALSLFLLFLCICSMFGSVYANSFDDFKFHIGGAEIDKDTGTVVVSQLDSNSFDKSGYVPTVITGESTGDFTKSAWNKIYEKYKTVINILYIIMTLTCLGGLILAIVKLGTTGGNPQGRQQAVMAILFCGIGVALLGSVGLWYGLAMNIL